MRRRTDGQQSQSALTDTKQVQQSAESLPRSSPILEHGLGILIAARLLSAWYSMIHDCDEVYNYWEPLHYLMYGYGMQTWEYSAAFALRSWWYILIHGIIGWPVSLVLDKVGVFYSIKAVMALCSAWVEYSLCRVLAQKYHPHVAKLYLVFSAFSSGMFVASSAFLPSSFAMVAMTWCASGVLRDVRAVVIWGAVVGCTWGWIVAALSFAPYALWVLSSSSLRIVLWSFVTLFVAAVATLGPLVLADRWYYGSWKASLVNFLEYNVQGGGKSDLYGVEPVTYYFRNGFNQLQVVLPLSFVFLLIVPLVAMMQQKKGTGVWKLLVVVLPAYVWFFALSALPHKEERFLYVVYPLLLVAAAAATVHAKEILQRLLLPPWLVRKIVAIGVLGTCMLSLSRTRALVQHYGGLMNLYTKLPPYNVALDGSQRYVCVGAEWYKYPSSFFLPGSGYRLQFVKSGFDGLLPRPFEETTHGTMAAPRQFNDDNRAEPDNYWETADNCDFFVTSTVENAGNWLDEDVLDRDVWRVRASVPVVDNAKSPAWTRAFYIPYVSPKRNVWVHYVLLERQSAKK